MVRSPRLPQAILVLSPIARPIPNAGYLYWLRFRYLIGVTPGCGGPIITMWREPEPCTSATLGPRTSPRANLDVAHRCDSWLAVGLILWAEGPLSSSVTRVRTVVASVALLVVLLCLANGWWTR
jgi:hypothetical protein